MTDPLLTPAEVADRLKVSIRHVYDLISSKELKASRLGHKTLRVKESDLDDLLARGAEQCN